MKILFLMDITHPSVQGGIESFGRFLKSCFPSKLTFVCHDKSHKKNELFRVEDVITVFGFSNIIFIKLRSRLFKYIKLLFKIDLTMKIYRNKISKLDKDICILKTPQSLKVLEGGCKKILVQHTQIDEWIKCKGYFNNERNLIDNLEFTVDKVVALSPENKKKIQNKLNLSEKKVVCIRHSSELPLLEEEKEKKKNLIMIARVENDSKRFDLAINAMKKLPEYTLNIYGDGKDRKVLEALRAGLGLQNVIFHGKTNQVKEKLDESGIFIMTSDFEGYPISSIEAMRRGLPIILRDTYEAASDIVQGNGVLLEKEWNEDKFVEAVHGVYKNYEEYSLKSIELGKRHNSEVIKKQWEKLLEKLYKSKKLEEYNVIENN
ncbi:glycosyltransferase [Ilyobacter polytropus]|uniref:Glycosyl transferase group 1 n=1 Tax=Ilyobacter polytropus (strain ATCC 51220 / DSM 2926 / LMG 16218 / CuHBu1) TaxID=572544 RepID=E3HB31_ILYPC|nr:glycosyltransferase [Ilyobacter polytropus]ADO82180.1 glycosyl transferase group 1 [Ilyobacter polytropus DSM 2926]